MQECWNEGSNDLLCIIGLYEAVGVIFLTTSLVFSIVYCKLAISFREAKREIMKACINHTPMHVVSLSSI